MTIAISSSRSPTATTHTELFVRSLAPTTGRTRQRDVVERLQALVDGGRIESIDCHVSGGRLCPSSRAAETEPGAFLLGRYRAFEQWARVRDRDLVGFEERREDDGDGPDAESRIRFPSVALAEFDGDRLAFVTPSRDDGEPTTVAERVRRLAV